MRLLACLLAAFTVGCAAPPKSPFPIIRAASLYPANEQAQAIGPARATIVQTDFGFGTVEVTMPDGEVLRGEFSIVRDGMTGFGSIFETVYGRRVGLVTGSTTTSTTSMAASSQGMVSAYGSKGTTVLCEVMNDNRTGHGYGACKYSTGALFRAQY